MCSYSHSTGMKTDLIISAERGESEKLQRLLDTGSYDAKEGDAYKVCRKSGRERERERERKGREREKMCDVDLLFLLSHSHIVDFVG